MPQLPDTLPRLGLTFYEVGDWLRKAKREQDRFEATASEQERSDHVLNFAITIRHIEYWSFPLHIRGHSAWPDHQRPKKWVRWVRETCPAMQVMADLVAPAERQRWLAHLAREARPRKRTGARPPGHVPFIIRVADPGVVLSARPDPFELMAEAATFPQWITPRGYRLTSDRGTLHILSLFRDVIAFWERFDPDAGPEQVSPADDPQSGDRT